MQNTITSRRVSVNLIALSVLIIVVGTLVGFVTGFAIGKPSAMVDNPALAPAPTLSAGWVNRYDAATNKWFVQHIVMTSSGAVIGKSFELRCDPEAAIQDNCGFATSASSAPVAPPSLRDGCGLDRAQPDC